MRDDAEPRRGGDHVDVLRAQQCVEGLRSLRRLATDFYVATKQGDRVTGANDGDSTRDTDELRDEFGGGLGIELGGRGDLFGATARHHAHSISHRERFFLVVRDEDRRDHEALLKCTDLVAQFRPHLCVEGGEWFIQQQQLRTVHQRARQRNALLLAAAVLLPALAGAETVNTAAELAGHEKIDNYIYSRDMLTGQFPSMETAFLHAFLANNSRYRLEASLSMLHYSDPSRLKVSLPNYNAAGNDAGLDVNSDGVGHFPSAAYMRVVA